MRILHAFAATVLLAGAGSPGQMQQTPVWSGSAAAPSASSDPRDSRHGNDPHPTSPEVLEHLEKLRQSDRQRRMIADTNRLLALAAELKAETDKPDKAGKEPPSADVLRKAQEIEKLARSVKDRMKG